MKTKPAATEPPEEVRSLPLDLIWCDDEWNCRQLGETQSDGELEENEIESLANSIEESGQDTPIVVCLIAPMMDRKFKLCSGFRRYHAMRFLEDKLQKTLFIKAFVRDYTPAQARAHNIRENVARRQLAPPEVAAALSELRREIAMAENRIPAAPELCASCGVGPGYGARLLHIWSRSIPEVRERWARAPHLLSVTRMAEVASSDPDKQQEKFRLLCNPPRKNRFARSVGSLERDAKRCGALLAKLEQGHVIAFDLDFARVVRCLGLPEGASEEQIRRVETIIKKAYEAGLNP